MHPIRNRFAHLNVSQTFTLRDHSLFPEVVPFITSVASRLSVLARATICELTAMWFCISPYMCFFIKEFTQVYFYNIAISFIDIGE